jgi:hypothetical protein
LLTTWAGPGINIAEVTKKRNPVGDLDNVAFEKENMKQEVESYPDGMVVNWSHLAQQYNIKNTEGELAKNGGQIAQKWLKSEGIDIRPGLSTNIMEMMVNKSGGRNLGDKWGGLLLRHHKVLIE